MFKPKFLSFLILFSILVSKESKAIYMQRLTVINDSGYGVTVNINCKFTQIDGVSVSFSLLPQGILLNFSGTHAIIELLNNDPSIISSIGAQVAVVSTNIFTPKFKLLNEYKSELKNHLNESCFLPDELIGIIGDYAYELPDIICYIVKDTDHEYKILSKEEYRLYKYKEQCKINKRRKLERQNFYEIYRNRKLDDSQVENDYQFNNYNRRSSHASNQYDDDDENDDAASSCIIS